MEIYTLTARHYFSMNLTQAWEPTGTKNSVHGRNLPSLIPALIGPQRHRIPPFSVAMDSWERKKGERGEREREREREKEKERGLTSNSMYF